MGHMDRTHQLHRETNQETSPQLQIMEEKLPEADKASIIPSLEGYFDLQPHLNDLSSECECNTHDSPSASRSSYGNGMANVIVVRVIEESNWTSSGVIVKGEVVSIDGIFLSLEVMDETLEGGDVVDSSKPLGENMVE
ncbi:hypothetical protein Tco_0920197 [Tanacetum coccineum]